MACSAVRDHEMRNLVAGLSGAVSVLTAGEGIGNPRDHGHLGAAARIELERLARILDSDHGSELAPAEPATVAVGPVLSGLAALHGLPDAPITVTTADDPQAALPPDCLAHVVTNLLVNCARHAPGARVRLTACRRGGQVVIKVSDDGPGLPPDLTAELLQPGVRGPSSTGTGLGLAVSAELVNRHGGAIRLLPTPVGGRGCTVVVQLPEAADDRCLLEQVAV
jgi:two-component system OmpR family sensor kinase